MSSARRPLELGECSPPQHVSTSGTQRLRNSPARDSRACQYARCGVLRVCSRRARFSWRLLSPAPRAYIALESLTKLPVCSLRNRASGAPTKRVVTMMPIGVPRVPYRTPGENSWQWVDLWNCLYRERIIFVGQGINEELGNQARSPGRATALSVERAGRCGPAAASSSIMWHGLDCSCASRRGGWVPLERCVCDLPTRTKRHSLWARCSSSTASTRRTCSSTLTPWRAAPPFPYLSALSKPLFASGHPFFSVP